MSRGIAVHVVAGILFVGVGASDAQESMPRPAIVEARNTLTSTGVLSTRNDSAKPNNDMLEPGVLFRLDCVAGIEGDVGVTVAIAPNAGRSPQDASDSRQAKAAPTRKRFAGAMRRMCDIVVAVCLSVRAGDEARR
jgi:hypothetical protein